jgi:hypothetical protein
MDSQLFYFHITVVRGVNLEMTIAVRTPAAQLAATSAAGEEQEVENTGLPNPPSQSLLLHTETALHNAGRSLYYTAIRAAHVPRA